MGIATKCYRCGRVVFNDSEPLYSITAISWKPGVNCSGIGTTTGYAYLCQECADGLEDYLDELWRKQQNGEHE